MTLASYISLLRIFLIVPIIYLTNGEDLALNSIALILFLLAITTDYLDGFLARKTNTVSSLGALLDLLADKLLVCIILIWLVYKLDSTFIIFPVLLIIFREFTVSTIRQFVFERIGKNPVKVTKLGKSKSTIQFIAISFLIMSSNYGSAFNFITISLLWLAAIISIYSLLNYLKAYKEYI